MKNLAIIPARSGSKGLINKNIKILNNKPLLAYSIDAAKKSEKFDKIVLSTDSEQYAKIGLEFGATVPFLRSKELSSDTASSWDVAKDILEWYSKNGEYFDTVTLLQPTSPLRTPKNINEAFELFESNKAEVIISVSEMEHSPLWTNTLPENLSMENFIDIRAANNPRQALPTYYRINGAIYITSVKHLFSAEPFFSSKSYAYIMSPFNSIDIDNELDFLVAEATLKYDSEVNNN